jgi:hypothetical protein
MKLSQFDNTAFDRSDLSQAEFCRRRGFALATFRNHHAGAAAPPVVLEAPRLVELFTEPGNGIVEPEPSGDRTADCTESIRCPISPT